MSFFDSFSKPKQSILSLNLEHPEVPPAAAKPRVVLAPQFEMDPALLHAAVPEIMERANAMFEDGMRPVSLYLTVDANGAAIVFQFQNPEPCMAVLVFTSGFQAIDYLRAAKIAGGVHEFPATSLQSHLQGLKRGGAGFYALDRCPRCTTFLPIRIEDNLNMEQFARYWGLHRATRIFQAQRVLRSYMDIDTPVTAKLADSVTIRREKRKMLELIRDHIDCSVPHLHWMIALEAGISHDEDVRLAAIQRLHQFGPEFHDKATLSLDSDGWARTIVECQTGLLAGFDMLMPEVQGCGPFNAFQHDYQTEINRRSLELAKSGRHPDAIFLLIHPTTRVPMSLKATSPISHSVMLFSSAANARFFMQDKKLLAEITAVEFSQFPHLAQELHTLHFDSFVMDLSPHSPSYNVLRSNNVLITTEQLTLSWATMRTIRNFQARQTLGPLCFNNPEFGSMEGQAKLRKALERLRGAGAYEIPFVHWVIALLAGMQRDEPARLAATADLEAFGPAFVGRTVSVENEQGLAEWGKSWVLAFSGLLTEFEMLNGPDGKPMESVLRTM